MPMTLEAFKKLATDAANPLDPKIPSTVIEEAILIRCVEEAFLNLFAAGGMNGTVHTCVGQEFSAVAIAGNLGGKDWVTSNHRCHGHFIAKTKNWKGLVDELMGLESGVCKGIGSSQHLYAAGFLSNGPQGSLVPVGTGIALSQKKDDGGAITVSFIGEGTLGEGVLYESLNLASLYGVPQLFVCENNLYSQSTPQSDAIAGDIRDRFSAFGIRVYEVDTWNVAALLEISQDAISYVRRERCPACVVVRTYRLNAHSKGDDDRDAAEVAFFREYDPLNRIMGTSRWEAFASRTRALINHHINSVEKRTLDLAAYLADQLPRPAPASLAPVENDNIRMVHALNRAYLETLEQGAFHIGEDIRDPYGGAFKVTKGFSTAFPDRVLNSSISEAGLVGVAAGMAAMGVTSYAEIMFGDFVTNIFDQLISNISKFYGMYAFQTSLPIRIRTPMGGKRGYGPTHSQSLEKFLLGIDNVAVVALSSLIDPRIVIREIRGFASPLILLENKVDYGKHLWSGSRDLNYQRENKPCGSVLVSPATAKATATIISYGETARDIAEHMEDIFAETDLIPELVALTLLHPLDMHLAIESVSRTRNVIIVEDGSIHFGIGAEVLSNLLERGVPIDGALRIGAAAVPIPSTSTLELKVLPTISRVIDQIATAGFGRLNG
jgi:2-oxoisovalerate dehydrogenase E1 component